MFSLTDRAWRAISARVRACSVVRADIASREVPANIRKFAPSAVRTPDPTKSVRRDIPFCERMRNSFPSDPDQIQPLL